ncbi:MAG: tRNA (adenosine(37)-N6)-threonylcarbamoyltransferase complex dimerization subunit type 1 TsaB [Acidobacteria bacterium]|nr:MAG: tRNA (adenosine(37)-N6)-threonylcarbamoyltransferase complex dimerization subunit type 1 TsaB [Acidobacteriota bacterium]
MKLLALDSSTDVCSICIADGDQIVAEYVTKSKRTHTERILPAIEFLFSHLDWKKEELTGLAVIHGPGSFTGLRISLSVVKGLAFALQLPVVAMNALEIAARQVLEDGLICPAMDARRGEIFTALFEKKSDEITPLLQPRSARPQAWKEDLPPGPILFCGPGAALYRNELQNHSGSRFLFTDFVLANTLAVTARAKFEKGETISGQELRAAYLRPSDAETKGPRARKKLEHIS